MSCKHVAQPKGSSTSAVARVVELKGSLERAPFHDFPLIAIDLAGREATDEDAARIATLTDLQRIDVSGTQITGLGLARWQEFDHSRNCTLTSWIYRTMI